MVQLTGDATQLAVAFGHAQATVDARLRAIEQRLTAGTQATQQFSERSRRHLEHLEQSYHSIATAVNRLQSVLASVGIGVGLSGLVSLARSALETAGAFEQLDLRLRFISGSLEAFQNAKQWIIDFTQTTQFQLGQTTDAFIALSTRGIDAQRVMRAVADATAIAGGGAQALASVVWAIGQIADRGRLVQQELNQLASAGIPNIVEGTLAELQRMGKQVTGDIGNAGISARDAIEAIMRFMEGRFAGMSEAVQTSWFTLMSNLKDTWDIFVNSVVSGPLLLWLESVLSIVQDRLSRAVKEQDAIFESWGETAVMWLEQVIMFIARGVDTLTLIGGTLDAILGKRQDTTDWLDTIALQLGVTILEAVQKLPAMFDRVRETIQTIVDAIEDFLAAIGRVGERIVSSIQAPLETVLGLFDRLGTAGATLMPGTFGLAPLQQSVETMREGVVTLEAYQQALAANQAQLGQQTVALGEVTTAHAAAIAPMEGALQAMEDEGEQARALVPALDAAAEAMRRWGEAVGVDPNAAQRAGLTVLEDIARKRAEILERRRQAEENADRRHAAQQAERAKQGPTIDPKAQQDALQAQANLLKSQEAVVQQSLKRQEALLTQSFAARRDQTEQFFLEEVRRAPGDAEVIAQARIEALRTLAQEEATIREQVALDANAKEFEVTLRHLAALKAAHAGQVAEQAEIEAKRLMAIEAFQAKQEAIYAKTAEIRAKLFRDATEDEVKELVRQTELLEETRQQGLEDFAKQTRQIQEEIFQEERRQLKNREREYQQFVDRVATWLNDIFSRLLNGTLNAVDFFRQLFLDSMARILAEVTTKFIAPIIAGIASTLTGALTSILPRGIGGVLMGALGLQAGIPEGATKVFDALGLTTVFAQFGKGVSWMTDQLFSAGNQIVQTFGGAGLFPSGFEGPLPIGAMTTGQFLTALGGLGGIGGGIFSALTADTFGGQLGGAIGAAGGATALASALAPALGVSLAPILGPIGLALAAIAPLLGGFLGGIGAPKGPRVAIGVGTGLDIGVEQGQLIVEGLLTSVVERAERIGDETAIQRALASGVTDLVGGMVTAINQVAIDPAALAGTAGASLQQALEQALVLNTSSRKNMEADIQAQLAFIPVQVASFLLDPLNQAFTQLDTADLDAQITRLPQTVAGMADVFKTMNAKLNELSQVTNADVLGRLGEVRARVDAFGARLVETAGRISEDIVTSTLETLSAKMPDLLQSSLQVQRLTIPGTFAAPVQALGALQQTREALGAQGLDVSAINAQFSRLLGQTMEQVWQVVGQSFQRGPFQDFLGVLQALPQALADLDPMLAHLRALGQAFSQVLNPMVAAREALESSLTPAMVRIQEMGTLIGDLETAIAAAGDEMTVALPLYDQLRQAVLTEMQLRIQEVQALGQVMDQIQGIFEQRQGPEATLTRLGGEIAPLQALVDTQQVTTAQLGEITDLYAQQLAALEAMGQSLRATIDSIESIRRSMQSASDRLAEIRAIQAALTPAPDEVREVAPVTVESLQQAVAFYAEMLDAINAVLAIVDQGLSTVQDTLFAQLTTTQQLAQVSAQASTLSAQIAAAGTATPEQLSELGTLLSQQLQLQQQQTEALRAGLDTVRGVLFEQLTAAEQLRDVQRQIRDVDRSTPEGLQELGALLGQQLQLQQQQTEAIRAGLESVRGVLFEQLDAAEQLRDVQRQIREVDRSTPEGLQNLGSLLSRQLQLQQRQTEILRGALESTRAAILDMVSPAEQIGRLRQEIGRLRLTADTPEELARLVELNQALLDAGGQADLLDVQTEALNNLRALEPLLTNQLTAAERAEAATLAQLQSLESILEQQLTGAERAEAATIHQLQNLEGFLERQLNASLAAERAIVDQLKVLEQWLIAMREALVTEQAKVVMVLLELQAGLGRQLALVAELEAQTLQQLALVQLYAAEQVRFLTGSYNVQVGIYALQADAASTLRRMEAQLAVLWEAQDAVRRALLPGAQQGGPVRWSAMAEGGRIPVLLEPGEAVLQPRNAQQFAAAVAFNDAFPRFGAGGWIVPGHGTGDTIPALLPTGSFVLNREAVGAMRAMGFQAGGEVRTSQGRQDTPVVNHTYVFNLPHLRVDSQARLEELKAALRDLERRGLRRQ